MNINNSFPSKWLKSGDILDDSDLILTIQRVDIETVGQGEDAEEKPVIYFSDNDKGLVLNKTNAGTIAALYTPETDNWPGKKIALFSTEVQFGSKMTIALRVRSKAPKPAAPETTNGSALWKRWYELVDEAGALGLPRPNLDDAASDDDIKQAGKALKARISVAHELAEAGL